MAFQKGNRFWEARSSHGRNPKFESAEALLSACMEYFKWAEDNPLWESKLSSENGKPVVVEVPKIRAMTIWGLVGFLGITQVTWGAWRKVADFSLVVGYVDEAIRDQKFAGAAAGLLNSNIIARDLGLRDAKDVDHKSSDGSMSPADAPLTKDEAKELLENNK